MVLAHPRKGCALSVPARYGPRQVLCRYRYGCGCDRRRLARKRRSRRPRWTGAGEINRVPGLLEGDLGALGLELGLGLVGVFLVGLLQDRLRRRLDQVLGLLKAQAGQLADHLDDLDLLAAVTFEDDVELVLLLRGLLGGRGAHRAGRDGDRGGRLDVEGVLELLHELGELDQRHLLERVEEFVGAELRHDGSAFLSYW